MKFCFFGDISGALKDKTRGGGELQVALLARALARNGHDVVIIDPYSSESFITDEGVKLITVPNWNKGLRGIRMVLYRIPGLWRMFLKQNADYYYVRMTSYLHLIAYITAKRKNAKFIQAIASDFDLLNFLQKFKVLYRKNFNLFTYLTVSLPNDIVFSYLLKRSNIILLQHSGQKSAETSINEKEVIFENIIDCSNISSGDDSSKNYFIYAGSLTMLKGADNLYKLISILNKKNLIIIVGQPNDSKSKIFFNKLKKMENVLIKGRLNHSTTLQLISNAKALINTSNYEGFPNIFLEAWANGIPVISLKVNPGDIICKYNLGICCNGDLTKMKTHMEIFEHTDFNKDNLISYVHKYHDFNSAGDRFLNVIN